MFVQLLNKTIRVEVINMVTTQMMRYSSYGDGDVLNIDIEDMEKYYRLYCYKHRTDRDHHDQSLPLINYTTLRNDTTIPENTRKAILYSRFKIYINDEKQEVISTGNFPLFLECYEKLQKSLLFDTLEV
jgi:hypothetical protein